MCKEHKHGKHAQTSRTLRHGGTCRQVLGMRARRARAGAGMARASKENTRAHKGLCPHWSLATSICVAGCVCGTCTMHRANHAQLDGMWITRGFCVCVCVMFFFNQNQSQSVYGFWFGMPPIG